VLTTSTLLHPIDRPNPILRWRSISEVQLLIMQIRTKVIAHQGEETSNRECLPAISKNVEVYRFCVVVV
jgi:hypothetical protein